MNTAVEEVQEPAPFFEDRRLILLLGELVIDVLKADRPGIIILCYPAYPVLIHFHKRNGLLRCLRHLTMLSRLFYDSFSLFPLLPV